MTYSTDELQWPNINIENYDWLDIENYDWNILIEYDGPNKNYSTFIKAALHNIETLKNKNKSND
jgi:hypothetical protein